MTAQVSDVVRYGGEDHAIAGIDGNGLFEPSDHGMEPVAWCTACWRGYLTVYAVEDDTLRLETLEVCLTNAGFGGEDNPPKAEAPVIGGVPGVDVSGGSMFEYRYENVGLRIPFTGGLLIARGFINELYVHMGFHPAWKYRHVHELLFEDGKLTGRADVSEKLAGFRAELSDATAGPPDEASMAEIQTWIERCFSRDYRL